MTDLPTVLCALLSLPIAGLVAAAWVAGFLTCAGVCAALWRRPNG